MGCFCKSSSASPRIWRVREARTLVSHPLLLSLTVSLSQQWRKLHFLFPSDDSFLLCTYWVSPLRQCGEGNGTPLQYSCLENPREFHGQRCLAGYSQWGRRESWMEEPGRLQSMGLERVRHDWVTSHTHTHILSGSEGRKIKGRKPDFWEDRELWGVFWKHYFKYSSSQWQCDMIHLCCL